MRYLSIRQLSEKWGISPRRIQILCKENRILGAQRVGYSWMIPEDAIKPKDARIKSGKYISSSKQAFCFSDIQSTSEQKNRVK